MIYLIGQLAIWLLLTAAFAGLAGWAFAAERGAASEEATRREREHLLRDLIRFTGEGTEREMELDAAPNERLLAIKEGRIAELERALETARARTDELAGELAEVQRGGRLNDLDAAELARLRAEAAERELMVDVVAEPVTEANGATESENGALQVWRLRYFEQRVKYLETHARALAAAAPIAASGDAGESVAPPVQEWIAREASARAAFLENELRAMETLPPAPVVETAVAAAGEPEPFAANADVDALLRWRLLYLERRVAHLQRRVAKPPAQTPVVHAAPIAPDPDRWKWRARYLEARVRHLEQGRPAVGAVAPQPEASAPQRVVAPPSRRSKPPVLAAPRNGAPDDLTLIEGVSLLQQTTLYALGVFHFDQIAAWSDENVAWVDQYLRLQGRIEEEEWVEQASALARDGVAAARSAEEVH